MIGLDDDISLYFLVAGHTKNVCDGAFRHVKRKLRKTNVVTPADMMRVIEGSASTTKCIPSRDVHWRELKKFLGQFFTVSTTFKHSGCNRTT